MSEAKTFHDDMEAKEYGKNFGKYEFEKIKVEDEDVILCGTDQAVETDLWGGALELVENFCRMLGTVDKDFETDMASKIRDLVISEYEKDKKVRFLNVYDEY